MKISVLGAGAVGSMIGGLIKYYEPSAQVVLVARGAHGESLVERQAVNLLGTWGMFPIPVQATFSSSDIANSDVVMVAVKSQDTWQAMREAAPYIDDALVLSLQNGINDDALEEFVARENLVFGVTGCNMSVVRPGTINLDRTGLTVVGPTRDGINQPASRQIRNLLRVTGLRVVEHPNVQGVRYSKLVANAVGMSKCLAGTCFESGQASHQRWRDSIGDPLLQESLELLRRVRIRLSQVPGDTDVHKMEWAFRYLDTPLLGAAVHYFAEKVYRVQPILRSLLSDLQRRRKTEVDAVNGQLVRLAQYVGYDVPYNRLVQDCVYQLESNFTDALLSEDEVLRRFQSVALNRNANDVSRNVNRPRLRIAG